MQKEHSFIFQLIEVSQSLDIQVNLEAGLQSIADQAAHLLAAEQCSVMLLREGHDCDWHLQVLTHYGDLPPQAYEEDTQINQGIAGHVAASGQSLLIKNISVSPFREMGRYQDDRNKSFMSTPIFVGDRVIGVVNVSTPKHKAHFTDRDLELLEIFALFMGKSIHIFQLQSILKSKFMEMALTHEVEEHVMSTLLTPNPAKLTSLVAKSFYQELTKAGLGPNQIVSIASEVLGLLQQNLDKHKRRLVRD